MIIGVFLLSCEKLKDEDLKITLNYDHKKQQEYPGAEQYYQRPATSTSSYQHQGLHQKNIYDETELNDDLTGTVQVPVNIKLEVEYKNYTLKTHKYIMNLELQTLLVSHIVSTTTVTVPVSVNPDHPSQVVEEETVDTIETVTSHTLLWSDNFTYRVKPTQSQTQSYIQFWDNASNYVWDNISIGNPDNMTTCDNSSLISEIALNIQNSTYEFQGRLCNGLYWTLGKCGWGNELSAFDRSRRDCACLKSTDIGYTIRPLIGNTNWGGVGASCNVEVKHKVVLKRSDGNSL